MQQNRRVEHVAANRWLPGPHTCAPLKWQTSRAAYPMGKPLSTPGV